MRSPVRQRIVFDEIHNYHYKVEYPGGFSFEGDNAYPAINQEFEEISDNPKGRGKMNSCVHSKHRWKGGQISGYTLPDGGRVTLTGDCKTGPGNLFVLFRNFCPAPLTAIGNEGVNSFVNSATSQWSVTGPSEMDLATDILELGQSINSISSAFGGIINIVENLVEFLEGRGHRFMGRPIQFLIDQFLGFEFGIAPLISSVESSLSVIAAADKRLKFLRDTRGRTVTLRQRRFWNDPGGYCTPGAPQGRDPNIIYRLSKNTVTLTIGCKLYHDIHGLDDAWARWSMIKAKAGLMRPYSSAWNLIPFSFLVDWIYDVKQLTDKLDFSGLEFYGDWIISDTWWSSVNEATISAWFTYGTFPTKIGEAIGRGYFRAPGFPEHSSVTGLSRLQQALAAALAGRRHAHYRPAWPGAIDDAFGV